jgi:PAS domain S-box-containing protein
MDDPLLQTCFVGIAVNGAGAAVAFYLWTEHRSERFLLFWTLAWTTGLVRWLIHYPAEFNPMLRKIESLNISVILLFTVLGSYDLLPSKPWRQRIVVSSTAAILLAYGVAANRLRLPLEMGYALFAMVLAFAGTCMGVAFRSTRLPGYLFAAATFLLQFLLVGILLIEKGRAVANSVVIPLCGVPLALSIVVIAYQRYRRKVIESEHTLQKIFDTAPTPIIIVRPPRGQIERANAVAFEMLGVPQDKAIGTTVVELGVAPDSSVRRGMYADLEAGRRVNSLETVIFRAGREKRTVSVNADRIALDSGDRYILSFFDLTELRKAEAELRASAEEMRQLYVRLANVEDDERRALHAELHDQLGANLSALRLELDVAASLLSQNDGVSAQQHLASAREVAAETMVRTRDLMAALRPPALDDYGLVAALRTFAESQSSRLNLRIDVDGRDLEPRPSPLVEGALLRIAQEAVMNAARHASAEHVAIDIEERDGRVILTIEDDGIGFDLDASGIGLDHWGLRNMRERALAIGGTLHVDTTPGSGTRVIAEAPREGA